MEEYGGSFASFGKTYKIARACGWLSTLVWSWSDDQLIGMLFGIVKLMSAFQMKYFFGEKVDFLWNTVK